jgi:hypothetical protein
MPHLMRAYELRYSWARPSSECKVRDSTIAHNVKFDFIVEWALDYVDGLFS